MTRKINYHIEEAVIHKTGKRKTDEEVRLWVNVTTQASEKDAKKYLNILRRQNPDKQYRIRKFTEEILDY